MEESMRKIKKPRSLNYQKTDDSDKNFENSALFSNQCSVYSKQTVLPSTLKSNSINSSEVSPSGSLVCSHERVQIELNFSSDEMSSCPKSKHLNKIEDEGGTHIYNKICKSFDFHRAKSFKDNIRTEQLSIDDSLLEKIDLSFKDIPIETQTIGTNTENLICGIRKLDNTLVPAHVQDCKHSQNGPVETFVLNTDGYSSGIKNVDTSPKETCVNGANYKNSPDIFNSNLEEIEEMDPEDQAWDMSISVVEDKDKSQLEENICQNMPVSQGVSDLILSTWTNLAESPPKTGEYKTFEGLLKKTLTSNAHKKIVLHSVSPRPLFSSPGSEFSSLNADLFFGLPDNVRRLIKRFKGISKLYDWQNECLQLPAIEKRKNLVYALPTSGGKTLVAEILVLKEILCREKNVLFVLPYVSITQEKVRALSPFAVELGFLVEEYAGSKGAYPPQKRRRKRSVYVATIEKALGLVHSLIECQRLQELGLVVVDELHLIGEPKRGANLESMLTKLMYLKGDVHIIGMSATIGNLSDISTFLDADVYTQDFRPVELTEYVKVQDELFKVDHSVQDEVPLVFHSKCSFQYSAEQQQKDPDQIGALVQEVVPEHSCLVFCPSKKNCENVALLICNAFEKSIVEHKSEEKKALFRALLAEGNGTVCPILKRVLPFGVAYHHSGLTTAERSLLEEAFLAKTVCCICCTSTLAAGVNLPARRVVLRSPYLGVELLSLSKYKQMIGRAGRAGLGDVGESFLLCRPQDAQKVGELLSSVMDVCRSQLAGSGLASLVLSAVDLALAPCHDSLLRLASCSLLAVQAPVLGLDLQTQVEDTLDSLVNAGALTRNGDSLALSNIGKAAVKANLDMGTAKLLYTDLQVAQDSLVLLSHLHLLYLTTPYTMMDQIPFQQQPFCATFMELGAKEIQTAKVLGIGDQCVAHLMTGRTIKGRLSQVLHRFYLSLILFDLWNRNSIWKVSTKYLLPRGLVHNFLVSASAFSSSIVRFCEVLEDMWCFKLLLAEMSTRLTHCCSSELLPLMELPAVKIGRAKQLYNAGFKTLQILAKTEPKTLVQSLDHMPRRVAHQIVAAAKLMLLAKAESLQEEAEEVLEGLRDISI